MTDRHIQPEGYWMISPITGRPAFIHIIRDDNVEERNRALLERLNSFRWPL